MSSARRFRACGRYVRTYALSLAAILGLGFLLTISLISSAVIAGIGQSFSSGLSEAALHAANFVVNFLVLTLLFAMMFKYLPDSDVGWCDVWIGAALTALLFNLGKFLIALYLGKQGLESTYGAASSIVLILVWIYYSAQIVFLGAEFTQVYARRYRFAEGQLGAACGRCASDRWRISQCRCPELRRGRRNGAWSRAGAGLSARHGGPCAQMEFRLGSRSALGASPMAAGAHRSGGGALPVRAAARSPISARPLGEPALAAPDSISWRVFKNPIALFIGGVAAVLLELAEPRVRSGVWDHTSFRTDPVRRLQRTGLAAMMTVYGPKTEAEAMIARVRHVHARIAGATPSGQAYRADDPELLNWVHATAAFGFVEAYSRFVQPAHRRGNFALLCGGRTHREPLWRDRARRARRRSCALSSTRCGPSSSLRRSFSNSSTSCAARRFCRRPRGRFSGCWCAPPSNGLPAGRAHCWR